MFIEQGYEDNTGGNRKKKQVKNKEKLKKYTDITMSEWEYSFSRAMVWYGNVFIHQKRQRIKN